MSSTKSH